MTNQNYPDTEEYSLSFTRGEVTLGTNIYSSVKSISIDQPTEEGEVSGMSPIPLKRSQGRQKLGTGTLMFGDEEERDRFIADLGNGYRDKFWGLNYVRSNRKSGKKSQIECISCRILNDPVDDDEGQDALQGEIQFSFIRYKRNGLDQHLV